MKSIIQTILLLTLINGASISNVEAQKKKEEEKASQTDSTEYEDGNGYEEEGMGISLAMQGRIDMMNIINAPGAFTAFLPGNNQIESRFEQLFVPVVTMGVRLFDDALFAGLGLGFGGIDDGPEMFSMSPLVSYDFLDTEWAALYALGWINIAYLNFEEVVGPNTDGDIVMGGLNFGLGLRGKINRSLSFGTEWGWGFVAHDQKALNDLIHGIWGNITLEASLPL